MVNLGHLLWYWPKASNTNQKTVFICLKTIVKTVHVTVWVPRRFTLLENWPQQHKQRYLIEYIWEVYQFFQSPCISLQSDYHRSCSASNCPLYRGAYVPSARGKNPDLCLGKIINLTSHQPGCPLFSYRNSDPNTIARNRLPTGLFCILTHMKFKRTNHHQWVGIRGLYWSRHQALLGKASGLILPAKDTLGWMDQAPRLLMQAVSPILPNKATFLGP